MNRRIGNVAGNTCLGSMMMALLVSASGCGAMRPTVEGVSARVVDINFERVALAIDVSVRNNAFVGVRTPGGRYSLSVAESPFLESDSVPPADLPAGGVGVISLPAEIEYRSLWKVYQTVRDAPEVDYRVEGALVFDVMEQPVELPFDYDGKLPVLRAPKIKLTKVEKKGVSLSGAEVSAEGTISNPNIFALGISDLGYQFSLGEIEIGTVQVSTDDSIEPGQAGKLALSCKLSASAATKSLIGGAKLGAAELTPQGAVRTPYGSVKLP